MARSFRKTKIFGHTGSSEKEDKRINNRMFRRKENVIDGEIKKSVDVDSVDDSVYPVDMDEIRSTWSMRKDGKSYWKNAPDKSMRK